MGRLNLKTVILSSMMVFCLILLTATRSAAYPTLQLDIANGVYDTSTQTIVATSDPFTLYAYLIPDCYNPLSDTYYISASITPKLGPAGSAHGSFMFNGATVNVTSDMTYGVPPLESLTSLQGWDKGDLPKHGIFPTYFKEFAFSFSSSDQISKYNTADRAISGGSIPTSGKGMYFHTFTIDTSALDPAYEVHFDLYNTVLITRTHDIDISQFAPFSHDAESGRQVPEPGTILLLGTGLIGLWVWKRGRIS